MKYSFQPETLTAFYKINPSSVAHREAMVGMDSNEPLLVCVDSLLRYAKAHEQRFEDKLSEDYVLGPEWLNAAKGIRALLNGSGAVAHELGISTDSKDNGMIESIFWSAMAAAGFKEEDL